MTGDRDPRFLTATLAIGFLLATSRWGSHLGAAPLFVTDVLLALAAFHLFASIALGARLSATGTTPTILLVLVAFLGVRALLSPDASLLAVRDAAPYAYVVVALLALKAPGGAATEQRTADLAYAALVAHAAWVAVAVLEPDLFARLPLLGDGTTAVFEIRSDHDGALLGIGAGVFARRALLDRRRFWNATLTCFSIGLLLTLQSRAGLAAGLVAVIFIVCLAVRHQPAASTRAMALLAAPVLILGTALLLPQTTVGERFGLAGDVGAASGSGTANARFQAWERVLDHTTDDSTRMLTGVGFGPDFLADSGASAYLEGAVHQDVRSPHNFLIGTFARTGLVGVALVATVLLLAVRHSLRLTSRREGAPDELRVLAGGYVLATLVTAAVGVTLETPFAAVPFYFFLGVLLRDRAHAGAQDSALGIGMQGAPTAALGALR